MVPRWLSHGTGQNTSQRSIGSGVGASSCHRGADYGVRRVEPGVDLNPRPEDYKSTALSN